MGYTRKGYGKAVMRGRSGTPPEIPPKPSGPDRCLYIHLKTSRSLSSMPEISFALPPRERGAPKLSTAWEASSKARAEELGFLDLPKEIRDMIYIQICTDLKREGWRWHQTAPRDYEEEGKHPLPPLFDEYALVENRLQGLHAENYQIDCPAHFSDRAVMRTCKQLHAEFAEVLYSIPIHIGGACMSVNVLPISRTYAPLVRSVLLPQGSNGMTDAVWRGFLQAATSLSKIFPNASTLRVGWYLGPFWQRDMYVLQRRSIQPLDAEKAIKNAKRDGGPGLLVPAALEMVDLVGWRSGRHPSGLVEVRNLVARGMAEAVVKSRAKPKKGKGWEVGRGIIW